MQNRKMTPAQQAEFNAQIAIANTAEKQGQLVLDKRKAAAAELAKATGLDEDTVLVALGLNK